MDTDKQNPLDELHKLSEIFMQAMNELELEQEQYWDSLTKEQQLKAFCAVVRRIHKGELEDKGTYRYVLYQVFGFGPESYAQAQMAGFLALHNSIFDYNHESKLLKAFCTKYQIEDYENKITEFLI